MIVGNWGFFVFEVNRYRTYTMEHGASRSSESNWATNDRIEGKPRSQYLGPGLRTCELSIKLRADMGVEPAYEMERLHLMAEDRYVYPLIIGGVPQAQNPMRLVSCSETKDVSLGGDLFSATASLKFEEYT